MPQDFLNNNSMKNTKLFNLLGWITDPNAPISNDGFVKLSKVKSLMTLWHLYHYYDQNLLSHNAYQKTGSNTIVDDLRKLGPGYVPYRDIEKPVPMRIKGQNGAPVSLRL